MKIFNTYQDLNKTRKQRKKHLKELIGIHKDECHFQIFEFLYENLNIIDSKSSSLLTYNSLVVAGLSVILTLPNTNSTLRVLYIISILFFIISSTLCLKVVYLHWSSTSDLKRKIEHMDELLEIREKRTIIYRVAWHFSFWSTVLIGFLVVYNVLVLL